MESVTALEDESQEALDKRSASAPDSPHHHARVRDPSLSSQTWYWPYTTRGDAEHHMAGQSDGSYLIRDSQTPGDFTLTLRKDGCTKCIRIYSLEKGYSLSTKSCSAPFPTLVELVKFYEEHSLSTFNENIDIKLTNPVHRPAVKDSSQFGLFKELYDITQEQLSLQTRLSILEHQREVLQVNVKAFELMMPALNIVKEMYSSSLKQQTELGPMRSVNSVSEHTSTELSLSSSPGTPSKRTTRLVDIQVLSQSESDEEGAFSDAEKNPYLPSTKSMSPTSVADLKSDVSGFSGTLDPGEVDEEMHKRSLPRDEEKSVTANTRLLMSRHMLLTSKLHSAHSNLDLEMTKLKELNAEVDSIESILLLMQKRHNVLTCHLMEHGCKREYLSGVLQAQVATREFDRSTWLVDCDRDKAQALLMGLPHGTFLVRHKTDRRRTPFVLSVVVTGDNGNTEVQHCYIVRPQNRGFGFNPSLAVFESLDQLILRHRFVSLKHYFSSIDVALTFPIGCQELLRRSQSDSDTDYIKVSAATKGTAPLYVNEHLLDKVSNPRDSVTVGGTQKEEREVIYEGVDSPSTNNEKVQLLGETSNPSCKESVKSDDKMCPATRSQDIDADISLYENEISIASVAKSKVLETAQDICESDDVAPYEKVEFSGVSIGKAGSPVSITSSILSLPCVAPAADKNTISSCQDIPALFDGAEICSLEKADNAAVVKVETVPIRNETVVSTLPLTLNQDGGDVKTPDHAAKLLKGVITCDELVLLKDSSEKESPYGHVWFSDTEGLIDNLAKKTTNSLDKKNKPLIAKDPINSLDKETKPLLAKDPINILYKETKAITADQKELISADVKLQAQDLSECVRLSADKKEASEYAERASKNESPIHEPKKSTSSDNAIRVRYETMEQKNVVPAITVGLDQSHSDDNISDDNLNTSTHLPKKLGSERLRPFRPSKRLQTSQQVVESDDSEHKPSKLNIERLLPFEKVTKQRSSDEETGTCDKHQQVKATKTGLQFRKRFPLPEISQEKGRDTKRSEVEIQKPEITLSLDGQQANSLPVKRSELSKIQIKVDALKEKHSEVAARHEKRLDALKEKHSEVSVHKCEVVSFSTAEQAIHVQERKSKVPKLDNSEVAVTKNQIIISNKTESQTEYVSLHPKINILDAEISEFSQAKHIEKIADFKETLSDIEPSSSRTGHISAPLENAILDKVECKKDGCLETPQLSDHYDHVYEDIEHSMHLKGDECVTLRTKLKTEDVIAKENPYESVKIVKRKPRRVRHTLSSKETEV